MHILKTGVARFLLWLTDAYIKKWRCKILLWLTDAYIKNWRFNN
jgi:hypothetical protein